MTSRVRQWQAQERRIAARTGGRRTPGSGNGPIKNDVRTDTESWECKWTSGQAFSLKDHDLRTARYNAVRDGRRMVFAIEFGSGKRVRRARHERLHRRSTDDTGAA